MNANPDQMENVFQLDSIVSILQIILTAILIIFILRSLINSRNKNIFYIFMSMTVLFIGSILTLALNSIIQENRLFFIHSTISYMSMLSSGFFLCLFIDSFKHKHVLTKKNLTFGILALIEFAIVVTFISIILIIFPSEVFQNSPDVSEELMNSYFTAIDWFQYISFTLLITNLVILCVLLSNVVQKVKHTNIASLKKSNIFIAIGIILQILNNLLNFYHSINPMSEISHSISIISQIILLISYCVISYSLLRGGLMIFQDESLRKIVLLDSKLLWLVTLV